jgi:hypothetical protein
MDEKTTGDDEKQTFFHSCRRIAFGRLRRFAEFIGKSGV